MPDSALRPDPTGAPTNRAMQVGAAMTVVGVIVVLAIFLPWADGIDNRPL